jgi:uncharacterized protein DUF6934
LISCEKCSRGAGWIFANVGKRGVLLFLKPHSQYISAMNLEYYQFSTNESFLNFEFNSEGPKGTVRKIVRFSPENANGITYFNLGFGDLDWNEIEPLLDVYGYVNDCWIPFEKILTIPPLRYSENRLNFIYIKGENVTGAEQTIKRSDARFYH